MVLILPTISRIEILAFILPTQLIINDVESLHQQLTELMASGDNVELDVSEVIKADTAGLQLLCVVQKSLIAIGQQIAWKGNSQPLKTTAKIVGVSDFLKL
jgi:ABC-type transporter Mla MlaB component